MLAFYNKQRTGECLSSYGNIKHPPRLLRLVAIFVTKESEGRKSNFTRFRCESPPVSVDVLPDIVFLRKVKQLSNLRCPLWTPHPWFFSVSQPRQIILTLLHYNQVQNRKVLANNASTNRLPSALSITSSISTEGWGTCSSNINQPTYSSAEEDMNEGS